MARHARTAHGFTLIELMTVVAILGLLASVAIPGYTRIMVRVREVERTTHLTNMRRSLVEQWRSGNFKLPASTDCTTMIPNDSTYKSVAFKTGITAGSPNEKCWNQLNWGIDGGTKLRFRYITGTQATPRPNSVYFDIYAYADLNSNGVPSYIQIHCVPDEKQECAGGVSYIVYSGDPAEQKTQTVNM